MSAESDPTLSFTCDFDERTAFEVEQKGFFEHAIAHLPDGGQVRVCFWDPVRLAQDLETEQKLGRVSVGEPGIIVIPKVTLENMRAAVKELYRRGYFERLRELVRGWPPSSQERV
jgi:hypothetical protein